jgi:hypothetical protein
MRFILVLLVSAAWSFEFLHSVQAFVTPFASNRRQYSLLMKSETSSRHEHDDNDAISSARRRILGTAALASSSLVLGGVNPEAADAAVGTLPESANTNAIIQGITVNVADKSQQDSMINFLTDGFDFKVLRKRIKGSVEETVGV